MFIKKGHSMNYLISILGYLSWPFMIIISYQFVKLALLIFNKNWEDAEKQ